MEKQPIILIAYGEFKRDFLRDISRDVEVEYNHPAQLSSGILDLSLYYDLVRRQYDANALLSDIDAAMFGDVLKKVGLFSVDLFIPILTYVFGQAYYQGNTGIVSSYRLKNEQYGMPADEELLYERFLKVIIHELGHTFGLVHCHVPNCVMRSSTYVEDIDQKEPHLCVKCRDSYLERI